MMVHGLSRLFYLQLVFYGYLAVKGYMFYSMQ